MKLTDELVHEYEDMVRQVAADYGRRYQMVDPNDIAQELWMWFLTHPVKVREWRKLEDPKESDRLFARSLRNQAEDFCQREKARTIGYDYDDLFWYSKEFVKTLIPAVLSDDWKRIEQSLDGGGKNPKPVSEAGDWMAYAADIRKAFDSLSEEEQNLVFMFYAQDVDGATLHEQAAPDRPSARAAMMAANRALTKIVKKLGGHKPYIERDFEEVVEDDMRTVSERREVEYDGERVGETW